MAGGQWSWSGSAACGGGISGKRVGGSWPGHIGREGRRQLARPPPAVFTGSVRLCVCVRVEGSTTSTIFPIACQRPTSAIDRCRSHCKLRFERCRRSIFRTTRGPSRSVSGPAPSGHIGKGIDLDRKIQRKQQWTHWKEHRFI